MLRNSQRSWGVVARFLHWLVAVLVFAQFGLGWAAVRWPLSPTKLDLFVWHKSVGMLVLALMCVRIAWRLANPAPVFPEQMTPLECGAARLGHVLLYLLLIVLPTTGWILSSASGIPFRVFWLVELPAIVEPDEALADALKLVHLALGMALAALLVAHISAALRHHFVLRDDVLVRMLTGMRRSG